MEDKTTGQVASIQKSGEIVQGLEPGSAGVGERMMMVRKEYQNEEKSKWYVVKTDMNTGFPGDCV